MTDKYLQDPTNAGQAGDFGAKIQVLDSQHHQKEFKIQTSDSTNFTTLPREIRDEIYALTLFLPRRTECWAKIDKECLRAIERGTHNDQIKYAFGLLSTKASTSGIVAEAREYFYKKNMFKLDLGKSCNIQDFLNRPCWSIARSHLTGFRVEPESLNEDRVAKNSRELGLLLDLPHLGRLQVYIDFFTQYGQTSRSDLRRALIVVTSSSTLLQARLGDNLSFEIFSDTEATDGSKSYYLSRQRCSFGRVRALGEDRLRNPPIDLEELDDFIPADEDKSNDDFARAAAVVIRPQT